MVKQTGTGDILNLYDGTDPCVTVIDGGNVGIGGSGGTDGKLAVIQYGTADIFNLYDSANVVLTVVDGGNVGIGDSTTDGKLMVKQTGTADIFNLYDNTVNVFTVVDGGRVGIGTNPNANAKLEVSGNIFLSKGADRKIEIPDRTTNGNGHSLTIETGDSQGTDNYGGDINLMPGDGYVDDKDGMVGIRTTDPKVDLDINGKDIRIRLFSSRTPNSDGYKGQISWYDKYLYLCKVGDGPGGSTDTWVRFKAETSWS
jgi:hypothetical protein